MKNMHIIIVFSIVMTLFVSLPAHAQPPSPTVVFLNFEGDPNFPSITTLRDTIGLAPFTGSAFRLTQDERSEVIRQVVELIRADFRDFNIIFVTDRYLAGADYFTWGIDDTAYTYINLNMDAKTIRVYGKAGGNPSTGQGEHPRHARTWAGSFTLLAEVELPVVQIQTYPFPIIEPIDCRSYVPTQPSPLEISSPPYVIPFEPLQMAWITFPNLFTGLCEPISLPITWQPSVSPLIPYGSCTAEERTCGPGWDCGRFGDCGPYISINHVVQAIASNAAHEISHLFGSYDLTLDANDQIIHPVSGNAVPARSQLLFSQDEWIEASTDKSFDADNYQILMNFLGPAPPANPEITSPTHAKGQPSCEQVLTVEWETPYAVRGVAGYSYTIVDQNDPYYDIKRWPDETIDLNATTNSFTTSLQPGSWEFNILTIDSNGTPSKLYSSFWVDIQACSVEVWVVPRTGAVFNVGEWVNIYWDPVTYGGDDVGACYGANLTLMKGPNVVMNIGSNIPNILWYGFTVPDAELGSDYNIRLILERESFCDVYDYPEQFIGFSDFFTIRSATISGDIDGDGDVDQNDLNILLSFRNQPASTCPSCDLDGDGMITALDSRKLVLLCTRPRCATE